MHKSAVVFALLALACLIAKFAWMDREFQAGRDALAQCRPNTLLPMEKGGSASLLIDLRDWPARRGLPTLYLGQAIPPVAALKPGACVVEVEVTPATEAPRSLRLDMATTQAYSFNWPWASNAGLMELHHLGDVRECVVLKLRVAESPFPGNAGLAELRLRGHGDDDYLHHVETRYLEYGMFLTAAAILAGAIAAIQFAAAALRKCRAQA